MLKAATAAFALLAPLAASAATPVTHYAVEAGGMPAGVTPNPKGPPFSAAVMAGDTLYIAGGIDTDPATGKPAVDAKAGAKLVLDAMRKTVERAGLTMNDLVWVQIFASKLSDYDAFNEVYRTYFTGPFPARAFLGAGALLNGAHFEVMGIAVRSK